MEIHPLFSGMNTSTSGMTAQRKRMNAIAENIANIETTRTEDGGPYRRKATVLSEDQRFETALSQSTNQKLARTDTNHMFGRDEDKILSPMQGVKATIEADQSPFREVYDPDHPDADENGMVQMPNVDLVQEMTDLISASRAFEANVTAFNATKAMMKKALEL
ncbi:MAG: flagellar basal body rod protein FlgC [Calditrichaeota bacterium]|nr:flagellar basal body rod protein FlgC [Calditrichota bacterium]MCB9368830.1 flagellar basal body rod protein FlgC [Calditrichota bacterium]